MGTDSWEQIVQSVEHYLGQDLLMHAATSSGSISMVTVLLDLYDLFRYIL